MTTLTEFATRALDADDLAPDRLTVRRSNEPVLATPLAFGALGFGMATAANNTFSG